MRKAAIVQPNYIPWKGYFDLIHDVDTFVFYDDVQYTKNDWRNRNIIKGPTGYFWLTIPISKSAVHLQIHQVTIPNSRWQRKHLQAIKACYSKSQYFDEVFDLVRNIYTEKVWVNLSALNEHIIMEISKFLGLNVEFTRSSDFSLTGDKMSRLLQLLNQIGSKEYISGPSGREYINEKEFESNGITLSYKEYVYPPYRQLWSAEFNHNVSILDLLFNTGRKAPYYIWGWRDEQ